MSRIAHRQHFGKNMLDQVRALHGMRQTRHESGDAPPPQPAGSFRAEITAVHNDHVFVQFVGVDDNAFGDAFAAAKPDQLRHGKLRDDATDRYPKIDTFVTVDENTAAVTLDSTTYEWLVTPNGFRVGDPVVVQYLGSTGVTVNNELVAWLVDP
ncbi:MAG: hypothetical protein AAGF84_03725, partial [Planctomycetota bacterium]